jgi:O-antigen ligase
MPLVSFKYALAETMQVGGIALVMATMPRLWPVALPFFLYSLGGVVLYTLFHHALHHFRSDQALLAPMPFFPEHTQYAAVLCLALPWALGLCPILSKSTILSTILSKSSRLGKYKRFTYERLRYKHLLLPALLLTGLLFSTCRAAWASLAGPLVLAVVCRLNSAAFHSRFRWLSYTFWGSVAIGGAVLLQHAFTTLAATDVSWAERLNRYDCASQMALARPLTGFGPGTFQFQYIPFQRAEKMTRISSRTPVMERTIHTYGRGGGVHSEYAQAAAEMGWPGAVLWSAGVACLLWMLVFGQAATAFEEKTGLSSWVPLFSLLAFFLHAFVNNFLHEGIVAALVWGQIGYLFSNSHHLGRKGRGL